MRRTIASAMVTMAALGLACGIAWGAAPTGTLDANNLSQRSSGATNGGFRDDFRYWAQTFTPTKNGRLTDARVRARPDEGADALSIEIRTTENGSPTGTVLASDTVPRSEIPTSGGLRGTATANFSDPPAVEAGMRYALVVGATPVGSAFSWDLPERSNYAGGRAFFGGADGRWTDQFFDLIFGIYLDAVAPKVDRTAPPAGEVGVDRAEEVAAVFSERMDPASIRSATFKLFEVSPDGTMTRVGDAEVSLGPGGRRAVLDPFPSDPSRLLAANTKYRAVVTTGAEDASGNGLDQSAGRPGAQRKVWRFTTGGT